MILLGTLESYNTLQWIFLLKLESLKSQYDLLTSQMVENE